MAFLDRFRTPPADTSGRRRAPSGRQHSNGFLQYDEVNAALLGLSGYRVFDEMWRTDADVRKAWSMCINPISGATWSVEPYGGEEADDQAREVAEFVEWALFEHMSPRLPSHINQALRMLRAGFVAFEQVWESTEWNGRAVLVPATLDPKLPRSVQEFRSEYGRMTGIRLYVTSSDTPGETDPLLPAEDLVFYRLGAEGDNWEGESPLRPAYKHWKYKNALELIDVMAHERFAMGIPVGFPPAGDNDDDLDALEDALAGIRANEQGYILAPGPSAQYAEKGQGWTIDILQPQRQHDLSGSLKYHTDKISASLIEEFTRLGQEQTGARATAESQAQPFEALIEAIATTVVKDTINEQLLPRLVALNFDPEGLPCVEFSLGDSTALTELANYIKPLADAGVLHADDPLEDFLREYADLPPADPKAREQRQAQAEQMRAAVNPANPDNSQAPDQPTDQPPPTEMTEDDGESVALARADRPLRWYEQTMQLDRLESTLDGARDAFVAAGSPAAFRLAASLAQVFANRRRKDPAPPAAPQDLIDALAEELRTLYRVGRESVAAELDAQRRGGATPVPTMLADAQPSDELMTRARLAAQATAQAVQAEMARAALGTRDTGELQAAGEAAARGALRAESQLHAATAVNAGRTDEAAAQAHDIKGVYYTSILDSRRCQSCATADDDVLRALNDPVRLRHVPPNKECFGGMRCRCMEAYVLTDEAPAALAEDQRAKALEAQAEATTRLADAVAGQKPPEVTVNVPEQKAPTVNVAPAEVNLTVPERKVDVTVEAPKRRTKVLRDADGNMTGTEEL